MLKMLFFLSILIPLSAQAMDCVVSSESMAKTITTEKNNNSGLEIHEAVIPGKYSCKHWIGSEKCVDYSLELGLIAVLSPDAKAIETTIFDKANSIGLPGPKVSRLDPSVKEVVINFEVQDIDYKLSCRNIEATSENEIPKYAPDLIESGTQNTNEDECPPALESSSEITMFITHASKIFDLGMSEKGLKNLLKETSDLGIDKYALGMEGHRRPYLYHFKPEDVSKYIESVGGAFQVNMPNTKQVVLAGGFLDACLCETLRDSVRFTDSNKDLIIYLVSDATYLNFNHKQTLSSDFFANNNKDQITKWLKKNVWGQNGELCPNQWSDESFRFKNKSLSLNVTQFTNGKTRSVKTFGTGKRKINVVIVNSNDIKKVLSPLAKSASGDKKL